MSKAKATPMEIDPEKDADDDSIEAVPASADDGSGPAAAAEEASEDEGAEDEDEAEAEAEVEEGEEGGEVETAGKPLTAAQQRRALAKQEREQRKKREKERKELVAKILEDQNKAVESESKDKGKNRLKYLLAQTEVFAHFIGGGSGGPAPKKGGRKRKSESNEKVKEEDGEKKKPKGARRGRMTEEEEDDALLETAENEQTVTRLTSQPACIKGGTMRPYQLEGLNWLIRLFDNGINGILADEMGLGKTLQSISLLGYLHEARGITGPHLIIAPKSTLGNWFNECSKWCPVLRVVKLHAKDAAGRTAIIQEQLRPGTFDVCITSYEVAIIEKASLRKFSWNYLMIDEAHRIKNENSILSQIVRLFSTQNRLLITGTPLQNNLHELWALLNFLLPDIFSTSENFDEWFNVSSGSMETEVVEQLHKVLRPFLLRRLKSDVEKSLPPKTETLLYVGLSAMQRDWYKKLISRDIDAVNSMGKGIAKTRLLNIMMQLRKCCNHPYLFQGAEPGPPYTTDYHLIENSGKMLLLDKLLKRLKENGSRVLIFSQMTRLLDILEDYCMWRGHDYCRIDGSTQGEDRDASIEAFNNKGSRKFCFLLSTRAGGLGINLATADTVVLYDSDWNPQVDLQAMDRAHRIGQTKPVNVFRFVTENTIEEKIIERASMKLHLDAMVIQQGRLQAQNKSLSKDEILSMIKYGAELIFSAKGSAITDEDIDSIISKGTEKTQQLNSKLQKNTNSLLSKLALGDTGFNTTVFEGVDYAAEKALTEEQEKQKFNFINLDKRARSGMESTRVGEPRQKRKVLRPPKMPVIHPFQFYPPELSDLLEQELWAYRFEQDPTYVDYHLQQEDLSPKEFEEKKAYYTSIAKKLTPEETARRDELLTQGFGSWSKKEYSQFIRACEKYGRHNIQDIKNVVGDTKTLDEVQRYTDTFFRRGPDELGDQFEKLMQGILKGEERIAKTQDTINTIRQRVESTPNAWQTLVVDVAAQQGTAKSKAFTEEEDRFLLCKINEIGYGNFEELKLAIRQAWEFRFDWFFKSRNAAELQRRVDALVKMIEKENTEKKKKARMLARRKRDTERKKQQAEESKIMASKGPKPKASKKAASSKKEKGKKAPPAKKGGAPSKGSASKRGKGKGAEDDAEDEPAEDGGEEEAEDAPTAGRKRKASVGKQSSLSDYVIPKKKKTNSGEAVPADNTDG